MGVGPKGEGRGGLHGAVEGQKSRREAEPACLSLRTACYAALPSFNSSDEHNTTFLHADGWGFSQMSQVNSLKMSIIGGIHAVQYFRSGWPAADASVKQQA